MSDPLLIACPTCGALPGRRCIGRRGPRRSLHADRRYGRVSSVTPAPIPQYRRVKRVKREGFYQSDEWRAVRYSALARSRGCCELCGREPADGVRLHVDHIKPRSKYPDLALDPENLQVLCDDCNIGKSNTDDTDWRRG